MTLEQLERRVIDLEREIAELRREIKPLGPLKSVAETFGMFADDPDFENIVKEDFFRSRFIGVSAKPETAAADFAKRVMDACARRSLKFVKIFAVAPWSIPDLAPYQGLLKNAGIQPVFCKEGFKDAADHEVAIQLGESLPSYVGQWKVDTMVFVTGDGHFATAIAHVKGSGLRTVVWADHPGRDLRETANQVEPLVAALYPDKTS